MSLNNDKNNFMTYCMSQNTYFWKGAFPFPTNDYIFKLLYAHKFD